MSVLPFITVALFGAVLGSFFNVLIYRVPRGMSIVRPRSSCPYCNSAIAWYDNIPILSYILLAGRCRSCKKFISPRYLVVEIVTSFALCFAFFRNGLSPQFFVESLFFSLLILVTFTDLETFLIPDLYSIGGIFLGLALSGFNPQVTWKEALVGVLIGAGVLLAIACGYGKIRGHEGMGGGDIKLLGMIGAFTGWKGVIIALFVSALSGLAAGLIVMAVKRQGLKTAIPYGPFLALGGLVAYLWQKEIIHAYLTLGSW
ncbi:prepilin peptidase [Thermodesulforhabdus norvegica]|uniref:Prepilin leader peptidase/N-methyltransferase n=1 Tax=Thermodesulforhabdus norvegica TaxID=39841 RepID=A0A1I4S6J1_9BACT|nr:A24 family peptidase [Thermodesulforhabdus norvegica]SFM59893.1 type 4 prepilin peptidase 1 Aspartic peptidase. MEROPS family A24A [Thermodesulforhabdus norvegica]